MSIFFPVSPSFRLLIDLPFCLFNTVDILFAKYCFPSLSLSPGHFFFNFLYVTYIILSHFRNLFLLFIEFFFHCPCTPCSYSTTYHFQEIPLLFYRVGFVLFFCFFVYVFFFLFVFFFTQLLRTLSAETMALSHLYQSSEIEFQSLE